MPKLLNCKHKFLIHLFSNHGQVFLLHILNTKQYLVFFLNLILVHPRTSQQPQSCIKYISQETCAEQVQHNESLWWLRKYIPHFNRTIHRYLYIHECIINIQLPIYSSYRITRTFGWVNRGAAWRVRMAGWNYIAILPAYLLSYTSKWVALMVRPGFELSTSCTGGSECTTAPLKFLKTSLSFNSRKFLNCHASEFLTWISLLGIGVRLVTRIMMHT